MENKAAEKLRIIDTIKENAAMCIAIGGFVWLLYSMVIMPIQALEYQVGDIIGNHLKTIQDEQVTATAERKAQSILITNTNDRLIKIETLLDEKLK